MFKVIRKNGDVVAFGPNDDNYQPALKEGEQLFVESNEPVIPQPAPFFVSPRQLRQALNRAQLRAQVEAAVSAGDQDLKDWWEFATEFQRNHPLVIAMAQGLGVSDSALDNLFSLAATL